MIDRHSSNDGCNNRPLKMSTPGWSLRALLRLVVPVLGGHSKISCFLWSIIILRLKLFRLKNFPMVREARTYRSHRTTGNFFTFSSAYSKSKMMLLILEYICCDFIMFRHWTLSSLLASPWSAVAWKLRPQKWKLKKNQNNRKWRCSFCGCWKPYLLLVSAS